MDLIRKILRASASIPGASPPVYIPVQGPDGRTYDEMHVDGGTASQLFLYTSQADWDEVARQLEVRGKPQAYLIRNSRVKPRYLTVNPKLIPIAGRTLDSLIRTQGIGELDRILTTAKRDHIDVKLAWIPEATGEDTREQAFDPDYMSGLFTFGYDQMTSGNPWLDLNSVFDQR